MAQVRAVRRMNRPGCNWGCLLFIAAAIAIDAAAFSVPGDTLATIWAER